MAEYGDLSADGASYWSGDGWEWQPLWLRADEVLTAARARFGRAGAEATFLAAGMLNQSWLVGEHVLRVGRPERSVAQVSYEHAVLAELDKRVPFVVPPLAGRSGGTLEEWNGWLLTLSPFIAGRSGVDVDPLVRAVQSAAALGRLHRVAVELDLPQRPGFRSVDAEPRWVWTAYRPALFSGLGDEPEFLEIAAELDREARELDAWLDGLRGRVLPRALVHGDFNTRNLIFDGDALAAVIDWDECRVDLLAWEAAQGQGEHVSTFWAAYLEAGGPLDARDVELFDGFARMGAFSEVQWSVNSGAVSPNALSTLREAANAARWLRLPQDRR